jgi:hypothetical protein
LTLLLLPRTEALLKNKIYSHKDDQHLARKPYPSPQWHITFWAFTKRHTTFIFASFVNAVLSDVALPQPSPKNIQH